MSDSGQAYTRATRVMAAATLVIGLALVVAALARGGGPLSYGVVVGLLFVALGGGRLYLISRAHRDG